MIRRSVSCMRMYGVQSNECKYNTAHYNTTLNNSGRKKRGHAYGMLLCILSYDCVIYAILRILVYYKNFFGFCP